MQITFNIPTEKVTRVVDAINGLYLVPFDDQGQPLFTENEWAKERLRRFVVETVLRFERREATNAAEAAIVWDDDLIS